MKHSELLLLLDYSPETGEFRWKSSGKGRHRRLGGVAGGTNTDGYRVITIAGKAHKAHRLAVFYVTGEMPSGVVDHINGVKSDNRICNLRDVDVTTNSQNRRVAQQSNKLGELGVYVPRGRRKFYANIKIDGKSIYVGSFGTIEEAKAAREAAVRANYKGATI